MKDTGSIHRDIFRFKPPRPERVEWLLNGTRFRHTLSDEELGFLPDGTTSNEALHNEVKDSVLGATMAESTMDLKLQVMGTAKLIAHNAALYHPTTTQAKRQSYVLARVVAELDPWNETNVWNDWCQELRCGGLVVMAKPELTSRRQNQQAALKQWRSTQPIKKFPSGVAKIKHSTAFNHRKGGAAQLHKKA